MNRMLAILADKCLIAWRKAKSYVLFYGSGRWIRNRRELDKLRNSLSGRRMFIICNGPSLLPEDLEKIHGNGDCSFAVNSIDPIFSRTQWRPTFYTVLCEGVQYSYLDKMNRVPSLCQFYRKESYSVTRNVRRKAVFISTDGSRRLLERPKFSEDCGRKVYTIGTSTYAMLQLAVFLGCRELYIIGCDNFYPVQITREGKIVSHDAKAYFEGDDAVEHTGLTAVPVWQMDVAFRAAHEYADAHGIKIYNATRGGCLEEFPRVDFDTLFEK